MKNFYIVISSYIFFIVIIFFGIPRASLVHTTTAAIWQMPSNFYGQILEKCPYKLGPAQYEKCVTDRMQAAGANKNAIAFTKLLNGQGFLADFHETGLVDVARVNVIAADHSEEFYLVNGKPNPINVDDPGILAPMTTALKTNPNYQALLKDYPNLLFWSGNHQFPSSTRGANGDQQFIFSYTLKDSCNACATVGLAEIAFNFNPTGVFLGTRLISVTRTHAKEN